MDVIIDSKLSWIQHIAYVKNKVSKGIGIIYKARRYLSKESLVNLYHSYVYPYLIYCIESWGNASNCHLEPLFILQKRIIRIITFSNYDVSSTLIFRDLNVLPLRKLVQNRIGMIMYKYANGLLPSAMNELYISNSEIHNHNTRQKHLLHTNKGNIEVYNKSFTNISPRVWNALQIKINVNVSISHFKTASKLYLLYHSLDIIYPK